RCNVLLEEQHLRLLHRQATSVVIAFDAGNLHDVAVIAQGVLLSAHVAESSELYQRQIGLLGVRLHIAKAFRQVIRRETLRAHSLRCYGGEDRDEYFAHTQRRLIVYAGCHPMCGYLREHTIGPALTGTTVRSAYG